MSSLIVEICRVDGIFPIPNKDRIEQIQVKGWYAIVGKGSYGIGDEVVFIPPDSIIPDSLIEKYNLEFLKNGGRVSTIKFTGTISQGLVLGLDCLPTGLYSVGDDVTNVLGIKKWQPPERTSQGVPSIKKEGLNPHFSKYTDIENIKNYPNVFQEGDIVVVLEKIHGSCSRFGNLEIELSSKATFFEKIKFFFNKFILRKTHEFVIGSHNIQREEESDSEDLWVNIAEKFDLKNKIPKDYIVYGELYGKGVQDLIYGLEDTDLVVFDIKYKGEYLSWNAVKWFCNYNNLKTVPELYCGEYYEGIIEQFTDGKSILYPDQIREGAIIKDAFESNHPRIGRKILKSVSVDYLLRKGDKTEFH
jgi:RNA ligase (TIGR02306 family)